jgi:hypothetical protein
MRRRMILAALTGLTLPSRLLAQKRLPRVEVLLGGETPGIAAFWDELRRLGWTDGQTAIIETREARANGADAVLIVPDPLARAQIGSIVARTTELRLPALFFNQEDLAQGALLVYGIDRSEPWRQAANYADRLLRGAKVAELPFVQPSRVVFGVNLKTARLIEATIPFDLLALADEVME